MHGGGNDCGRPLRGCAGHWRRCWLIECGDRDVAQAVPRDQVHVAFHVRGRAALVRASSPQVVMVMVSPSG